MKQMNMTVKFHPMYAAANMLGYDIPKLFWIAKSSQRGYESLAAPAPICPVVVFKSHIRPLASRVC